MSETLSTLMTSVDPAMIVLTTVAEGSRAGCLVGFHCQSSIGPEHYCVWLSKANRTYEVALRARHFAVHFLASDDLPVAEHFGTASGQDVDKFAELDLETDGYDVPLLRSCPNRVLLDRITLLDDGGDHVCLTARVRRVDTAGPFTPLRLSDVAHLDPGHEAEERAIQPR